MDPVEPTLPPLPAHGPTSGAGRPHPSRRNGGGVAVSLRDVLFGWDPGTPVLDIPDFEVARGEKVFLHGPSGCGKSTLLALLGGVVTPQSGVVRVLDQRLDALSPMARDAFRADHIGIIFQMFNLVPYLTMLENVTLACRFSPRREGRAGAQMSVEDEAQRLLRHLELGRESLEGRAVTELSVGQQQRVAAARALIGSPEILIADEPTSALDADARSTFLSLLMSECDAHDTTVIFVSHDRALARHFDTVVDLRRINRAGGHGVPVQGDGA